MGPNESEKTTLTTAQRWALFGEAEEDKPVGAHGHEKKRAVIHRWAERRARVELRDGEGRRLEVARRRRADPGGDELRAHLEEEALELEECEEALAELPHANPRSPRGLEGLGRPPWSQSPRSTGAPPSRWVQGSDIRRARPGIGGPRARSACRGRAVSVDELRFWLEWYAAWDAVLEAGGRSVSIERPWGLVACGHFEPTIARLDALIARAADAPVSKFHEQTVHGIAEEDGEAAASEDAGDWPAPELCGEAASALRAYIRKPYDYAAGDPFNPEAAPYREFEGLAAGVRALEIVRFSGCSEDECFRIRSSLGDVLTNHVLPRVSAGLDFLSADAARSLLERFGLARSVLTPFLRFVDADLTLERLKWDPEEAAEEWYWTIVDDGPSEWECPLCERTFSKWDRHDADFCDGSGD